MSEQNTEFERLEKKIDDKIGMIQKKLDKIYTEKEGWIRYAIAKETPSEFNGKPFNRISFMKSVPDDDFAHFIQGAFLYDTKKAAENAIKRHFPDEEVAASLKVVRVRIRPEYKVVDYEPV